METVKHLTSELKRPTEKERLELVEKKVEIQKKRLEIKKEKISMSKIALEKEYLDLLDKKVSIRTKELENKKAELDMEEILVNRNFDVDRMLNDKIFSVLLTLASKTIDEDRTILGSEPFYKPLISGHNREIVIQKLIELITKL